MIKLFYITNKPEVAKIAQSAGVDRIFVDMEHIGKEERQHNMNTVKNIHTVEDVKAVKKVLNNAKLLVRVNPIHENSEEEIDSVIKAGADYVMLPMWKTVSEVERFIRYVGKSASVMLLLETKEAAQNLDEVLKLDGIDEIHIGLNDLHLSLKKKFMFELLVDGTVDGIAEKIKAKGIPFGIGGVGGVGKGATLPAEYILAEHYRLGSSMAILSRSFCNTEIINDLSEIKSIFDEGIKKNREYESFLSGAGNDYLKKMHRETKEIIEKIVK